MKKIALCLIGIALMVACNHKKDRDTYIADIENMEQNFEFNLLDTVDPETAPLEMIGLYRQFYTNFPDDSLAPVYMQRAADMNISISRPDDAIAILDSIINLYPGYEDIAGCCFLKGYAYETAEDYDAARQAYTYFVETYPDHYLAKDTRTTIHYLGLSAEEMFEAIMSAANDKDLVQE